MKILVALFVYNERPYLSSFINYYKSHGCELLFVDNCSTDGTYEYLLKRGIKVTQLDTKESFQLRLLQDELTIQIKKAKPDWVVYTGADLYYSFDDTITETIKKADQEGYNQIAVQCISAMNTGEEFKRPIQNTYFYGILQKELVMISKYEDGFFIIADSIKIPNPKVKVVPGIVINYGACKPIPEQKIKLQRRQKAWDEGMHKGWGTHYLSHETRQWCWTKGELIYFPDSNIWKYLQKIITK